MMTDPDGPEEAPDHFEEIYRNVNQQMKNYEEYQKTRLPKILSEQIQKQFDSSKQKIQTALVKSEMQTMKEFKEFEQITDWISILKTQRSAYTENPDDDEQENDSTLGSFILSFKENVNDLKTLQTDLTDFLRGLIDKTETPLSTRLKKLYDYSSEELERRQEVQGKVNESIVEAERAYQNGVKENEALIQEMKNSNEKLDSFTDKESFLIVQKAKKARLIQDDWKEKKAQLQRDIQQTQDELDSFTNIEKGNTTLLKQIAKCDDELQRFQIQYQEQIRAINEEISITHNTHNSMMNQLQKELEKTRNTLVGKEKSMTNREMKNQKSSGERMINKFKKTLQSSAKNLEKTIKKLSSSKKSSTQEDLDHIIIAIEEEYKNTGVVVKEIMDQQLNELQEIQDRNINNHKSQFQQRLKKLSDTNQNRLTLLESRKQRLQQQLIDREIECTAVQQRLTLLESIIQDITIEVIKTQEKNEKLLIEAKEKSDEQEATNKNSADIFNSIEKFVSTAHLIIMEMKKEMEERLAHTKEYGALNAISLSNPIQKTKSFITKSYEKEEQKEISMDNESLINEIEEETNDYNSFENSDLTFESRNEVSEDLNDDSMQKSEELSKSFSPQEEESIIISRELSETSFQLESPKENNEKYISEHLIDANQDPSLNKDEQEIDNEIEKSMQLEMGRDGIYVDINDESKEYIRKNNLKLVKTSSEPFIDNNNVLWVNTQKGKYARVDSDEWVLSRENSISGEHFPIVISENGDEYEAMDNAHFDRNGTLVIEDEDGIWAKVGKRNWIKCEDQTTGDNQSDSFVVVHEEEQEENPQINGDMLEENVIINKTETDFNDAETILPKKEPIKNDLQPKLQTSDNDSIKERNTETISEPEISSEDKHHHKRNMNDVFSNDREIRRKTKKRKGTWKIVGGFRRRKGDSLTRTSSTGNIAFFDEDSSQGDNSLANNRNNSSPFLIRRGRKRSFAYLQQQENDVRLSPLASSLSLEQLNDALDISNIVENEQSMYNYQNIDSTYDTSYNISNEVEEGRERSKLISGDHYEKSLSSNSSIFDSDQNHPIDHFTKDSQSSNDNITNISNEKETNANIKLQEIKMDTVHSNNASKSYDSIDNTQTSKEEEEQIEEIDYYSMLPHEPIIFEDPEKSKRKNLRRRQKKNFDDQNEDEDDLYQRLNKRIPRRQNREYHTHKQNFGESYIPSLESKSFKPVVNFRSSDSFTLPLVKSKFIIGKNKQKHGMKEGTQEVSSGTSLISPIQTPRKSKKSVTIISNNKSPRKLHKEPLFEEKEINQLKQEEDSKLKDLVKTELGLDKENSKDANKRKIKIKKFKSTTSVSGNKLSSISKAKTMTNIEFITKKSKRIPLKTQYSIRRWYGSKEQFEIDPNTNI